MCSISFKKEAERVFEGFPWGIIIYNTQKYWRDELQLFSFLRYS